MKTMITRNNVPRHNGTMRCLLGRSGLREFWVITPRHGPLLRGSERKYAEDAEVNWELVEARGSRGSCREAGGRQGRGRKGYGRVRRGPGGPEGCGKVRKRQKGTGSNSMLQQLVITNLESFMIGLLNGKFFKNIFFFSN